MDIEIALEGKETEITRLHTTEHELKFVDGIVRGGWVLERKLTVPQRIKMLEFYGKVVKVRRFDDPDINRIAIFDRINAGIALLQGAAK